MYTFNENQSSSYLLSIDAASGQSTSVTASAIANTEREFNLRQIRYKSRYQTLGINL